MMALSKGFLAIIFIGLITCRVNAQFQLDSEDGSNTPTAPAKDDGDSTPQDNLPQDAPAPTDGGSTPRDNPPQETSAPTDGDSAPKDNPPQDTPSSPSDEEGDEGDEGEEGEGDEDNTPEPTGPAPGGIYDVTKYGAKPDGKKDSAMAFIRTFQAACHGKERATVLIPKGTFLIGPVTFQGVCSNPFPITVQIDGELKALSDISEYPDGTWFAFSKINGLIVNGGHFDGQGKSVWEYNNCKQNKDCQMLPVSVKFAQVKNAVVQGINSINSMGFHMGVNRCNNITFTDLTITAPATSPNTDGMHISLSNDIHVSHSTIGTGDDCISIGAGTTNLNISQITCGPGHGISVGSLGKRPDETDVNGIYITNCTLTNTDNGARIKSWGGSPVLQASKIYFQDLVMNNVQNPIIIDQSYCSGKCKGKNSDPSRVKLSDIKFTNIRGTSISDVAVSLMCSEAVPCENVEVTDINLEYSGGKPAKSGGGVTSECANAKVNYGGVQKPPACN